MRGVKFVGDGTLSGVGVCCGEGRRKVLLVVYGIMLFAFWGVVMFSWIR